MLAGKGYSAIDTAFSFIVAFVDRVKDCNDISVLTRIHKLNLDIVNQLLYLKAMFGAQKVR